MKTEKEFETSITPEKLFWKNEVKSNHLMCTVLVLFWGLWLTLGLFSILHIFWLDFKSFMTFFGLTTALMAPAIGISVYYKGEKKWIKTMLTYVFLICVGIFDTYLGYNLKLMLVVPMLVSVRYYSRRLTWSVCIASFIVMFISCILNTIFGEVDLNMIDVIKEVTLLPGVDPREIILAEGFDEAKLVWSQLQFGFLPEALVLVLLTIMCVKIAGRSQNLVVQQAQISAKTAQLETELNLASSIQSGLLPNIFPPFPDRHEFDIYASMKPAKEIGGDFYDFFMIDEDHLALVMADVSGKGVPAALFMMISKALLKTQSQNGHSPAMVLEKVNNQLCENNSAEMFVTVWLGIYEISTGKLVAANAGHEYPAIRRANGLFELYKDKHGFVVAGMENMTYTDYELQLEIGDSLFVYTDGLPEATNTLDEQFGYDRMLEALNYNPYADMKELLATVHTHVDTFVNGANQFDDLTMLAFQRKI
ncbi:MAG: PP2C family protein-serine/threonine phosphatase [Fibrobacter sp.]|nr:PP2C family protein-serine/threonine phosphatase [Fibrobacter sp.]